MKIIPIILSAGLSQRMEGFPKALLEFRGKSALSTLISAYRRAGLGTPVVVLGHRAREIEEHIGRRACRIVLNARYRRGRSSSVKRGVRALPPDVDAFFIHPVDIPLVHSRVIEKIVDRFAAARLRKDIYIPSYRRRCGHPVLLAASLMPEILALGDDEPLKSAVFRDRRRIAFVPVRSKSILLDVNTRDDYRKLLKYAGSRAILSRHHE